MLLATSKMAERYAKQRSMVSGIPEGEEMNLFTQAHKLSPTTAYTDKSLCRDTDYAEADRKGDTQAVRWDCCQWESQAIFPIKSSFEPVKWWEEDVGKEKELLEMVVHEEKGLLEVYHDEETKGLQQEACTSQNPGSSYPPWPHLLTQWDILSTLIMTRIMRMKSNEHVFDHPSMYMEQRWIWIPRDHLGLSKVLVEELWEAGVFASDEGAVMDKKGIVEVTRNPPDEEWVDR